MSSLDIRAYLVRNGFAWGATSYSSTALIPGRAADETAALWDLFVQRFGRPEHTYVTGRSMGGAATHISVERYPDRYDGGLGLCGYAGQEAISSIIGDLFIAGAFVAGVTQEEFDSADVYDLIGNRIRPELRDPAAHARFVNILLDITGGPRAFDRQGFLIEEETNWERTAILTGFRLYDNSDRAYRLGKLSGVDDAEFNRSALRVEPNNPEGYANFIAGNEVTGNIEIPLLTLHTTGDWQTPINQQQILREKAEAAGKGDLLVQRIVRDAEHCSFTGEEWETALEDIIAWAERGQKPQGENVLVDDLRELGGTFTLSPRFGMPEADRVRGAGTRLRLGGSITLDGVPFDGFVWADVLNAGQGATAACYLGGEPAQNGRYSLTLASADEIRGCGGPASFIRVHGFANHRVYSSQQKLAWISLGNETRADVTFGSAGPPFADPPTTRFYGSITRASGERVGTGTTIEAYAGDVLCGMTSVPHVVMAFTSTDGYLLDAAGPGDVPGCEPGATLTFRVDGVVLKQTASITLDNEGRRLDLIVP